jgi:2-polyprenyl-3-methyl-5-hydroxy-6-metoxy-1,4-benzoquinol methylase
MKTTNTCRFCKTELKHLFVDLGMSPIANAYIKPLNANKMEPFYPLKVFVCTNCFLVQLPSAIAREVHFNDEYAYFSSFSKSWLIHAKEYVDMMVSRFPCNKQSSIVELASNDGYLLQYFKEQHIPVLGVEPCANVAKAARKKGIPTLIKFFGRQTAREIADKKKADVIIANNVLAHVPDINDFVRGMKILLATNGVVTVEFPHLYNLVRNTEFDTIYHEHYSYLSFITVEKIFAKHGLTIFDVEEIPTHGGSLRIFAKHSSNTTHEMHKSIERLRNREIKAGYTDINMYLKFGKKVQKTKQQFLEYLIKQKRRGKTIVGYGAPAKGNTFLNYCGVGTDFIDYTVDASPYKQNHLLPGTHIPVYHPDKIKETQPDIVVILPWNLKEEVSQEYDFIHTWGGHFLIAVSSLNVF